MKTIKEFLSIGTAPAAYGGGGYNAHIGDKTQSSQAIFSSKKQKEEDKKKKLLKRLPEEDSYEVKIEKGDEVKVGKFKNRTTTVDGITKDDKGQPVLKTDKGDQKLFKPRVSKLDVNEDKHVFGENPFRVWKNAMDRDLNPQLGEDATCDVIDYKQLRDLEKFGDRLLKRFDIDIEFTRHFGDRLGDDRNKPCIKIAEIQQLFKKIQKDKGYKLRSKKDESVLVDTQTDLNLPFAPSFNARGQVEITLKTVLRKKNFVTRNDKVKY